MPPLMVHIKAIQQKIGFMALSLLSGLSKRAGLSAWPKSERACL